MWLINTKTFKLEEFITEDAPEYAILSHRWQGRELQFRDLENGHHVPVNAPDFAQSIAKIRAFCTLARRKHECLYAWVDTCCIDKSSSSELSEAINAMFRWYKTAKVCIVYLHDIKYDAAAGSLDIGQSEWFDRGWTLQELLAPHSLVFYDQDWALIGDRGNFEPQIESRTGITAVHLKDFRRASVAQRMYWASKRRTTRGEDMAYSLLGLFNVNMPLLYGEGEGRAFRRLQLEIMRSSNDESIFAWQHVSDLHTDMLAWNVAWFSQSGDVIRLPHVRKPYEMTNCGLKIELELGHQALPSECRIRLYLEGGNGKLRSPFQMCAKLHCTRDPKGTEEQRPLLVFLEFYNRCSWMRGKPIQSAASAVKLQEITQCRRRTDLLENYDRNDFPQDSRVLEVFVQ